MTKLDYSDKTLPVPRYSGKPTDWIQWEGQFLTTLKDIDATDERRYYEKSDVPLKMSHVSLMALLKGPVLYPPIPIDDMPPDMTKAARRSNLYLLSMLKGNKIKIMKYLFLTLP